MTKALDRITLLETFARIADRGSISAAARDLQLSQASVSRQLKALEDAIGVELVRRTTHALALTPAGQAALRDARELLTDWAAFLERHGASDEVARGPLKVVAPVALGQTHLADIALSFQQAHPEVSLVWELDDHPIRFAEVGCDCWIKVGRVADDTLIVRPLGAVERLVVAAPQRLDGGPLGDPAAAATLPFVTLAAFEGDRIALYGEDGSEVAFTPSVALSTNNIVAARRAACLGVGAAILPRWFVADELASGALVNVLPRWRAATLTIHVAYLPARHQPRRLALFLQAIEAGLREVPGIAPAGTR